MRGQRRQAEAGYSLCTGHILSLRLRRVGKLREPEFFDRDIGAEAHRGTSCPVLSSSENVVTKRRIDGIGFSLDAATSYPDSTRPR